MLDISFLDTLSRLKLAMGHKSSLNLSGNRKSLQKGSSTEFSDFREYMPGDDIRRIDWNAYGRLDRLYIKEYMEEKEMLVRILLDTSASMNYNASSKKELAEKLAASFAFIALNHMDRVQIYDLRRPETPFLATGGRKALPRMLDWLDRLEFTGTVNLSEALPKLSLQGSGVTIIISDFLQEDFVDASSVAPSRLLRYLQYKKQKTLLLQVLAEEELRVTLTGTLKLIDMEDDSSLRLTMENKSIQTYEKALKAFRERLQKETAKAGAAYALCDTGMSFNQLIFQELRFAYDI
ncbi:MAG: DUF58 domain-containing protein [Roseburia sp.]|nr:DUF58 domain-containing protein [Roseburia sp.]